MPARKVATSAAFRDDIGKIVAELQPQLKPGNTIQVLGQIQSMQDSFRDLGVGLLFASVFVYLLMVVNYQNFGDPFVVILALPATLVRHPHDAVHHRHHPQRALAHGRDHGGRRRLGKLNSASDLRARAAAQGEDARFEPPLTPAIPGSARC